MSGLRTLLALLFLGRDGSTVNGSLDERQIIACAGTIYFGCVVLPSERRRIDVEAEAFGSPALEPDQPASGDVQDLTLTVLMNWQAALEPSRWRARGRRSAWSG
jgi:hypothetical protein